MILSSIFGKTKPINFILLITYLLVVSLITLVTKMNDAFESVLLRNYIVVFLLIGISMFMAEFICKRNNLSLNNNFVIYSFITLISVFPAIFFHPGLALAGWFVIVSIRKIITLKSQKGVKRKIYDASLWIGLAVLFYNWSILMVIPLYTGIVIYAGNSFKNLFIPLVAFGTVLILSYTGFLWFEQPSQFMALFSFKMYMDLENFIKPNLWLPSILPLLLIFISVITFFVKSKLKTTSIKTSLLVMLITLFSVMLAIIIGPKLNGAAYVLIGFPLAIFTGNYLELISKKWILEGLLWLFLLLPFVNLLL